MNVALKYIAAPVRFCPKPSVSLIGLGVLMALGFTQGVAAQESGAAGAVSPSGDTQATSPYYIGASQGISHESNVFRVPPGAVANSSDNISTTSIFGGIDQPFGRQHLAVNGSVRRSMYQENTDLNNTGFGLNANLDWETVHELSGNISYNIDQNLARYGYDSGLTNFTGRNIEKSQELQGTVRWGGRALLSLEAIGTHQAIDYSALVYQSRQYTEDSASFGVKYRPSSLLTVGAAVRLTRTSFPFGATLNNQIVEDTYDGRNLDLTATYVYSGQSSFDGRLSIGKQDGTAVRREFSGLTGYVAWNYRPTGKLNFNTFVSRDTGTQSAFLNFNGNLTSGIGDDSTITNNYGISTNYAATSKIALNASARYTNRDLSNFSNGSSDASTYVNLGASYQATRTVQLGCNASVERHNSSGSGTFDFNANVFGCTASITLR